MFDIGIDKLVVVGILVGLIMGPERLREWRRALPRHLGRLYALYQQGRSQVVSELDDLAPDWREYDPRQLHPRSVLRDLEETAKAAADAAAVAATTTASGMAAEVKAASTAGEMTDPGNEGPRLSDPASRGVSGLDTPAVTGDASAEPDDVRGAVVPSGGTEVEPRESANRTGVVDSMEGSIDARAARTASTATGHGDRSEARD